MLRATLTACLAIALPACGASDTLPEPEPTLETPGAFVAVDEGGGKLTLLRTLDRLVVMDDTILFFTFYEVSPADFEDARELSRRADLPIRFEAVPASEESFLEGKPFRIVWFRTLTDDEEARVQ